MKNVFVEDTYENHVQCAHGLTYLERVVFYFSHFDFKFEPANILFYYFELK